MFWLENSKKKMLSEKWLRKYCEKGNKNKQRRKCVLFRNKIKKKRKQSRKNIRVYDVCILKLNEF